MAALIALILFVLAAFGVDPFDSVELVPLGLAFLALALLLDNWPFGAFTRSQ